MIDYLQTMHQVFLAAQKAIGSVKQNVIYMPISEGKIENQKPLSLYEPQTWRNHQAQQIAKSLHIWPDKLVCCLGKDNITRLVKNPSHTPRWEEKSGVKCCMSRCDVPSFTQSKIASQEQVNVISHTTGALYHQMYQSQPHWANIIIILYIKHCN